MSDGLNDRQRMIAETLDGMVLVDAGPGTGKTHTIVSRYVNLISRPDVDPRDVLLLTFTNNAANEMEERIKGELALHPELESKSRMVQAKTFDAFCLSVIMDSPEDAGRMFGIDERLTRGATISSNESLNKEHFRMFLDRFLHDRLGDYGDWESIASQNPDGLLKLINNLMSRGVYPMKRGWFGMDSDRILMGDIEATLRMMESRNIPGKRGGASAMADPILKLDVNNACDLPTVVGGAVDPQRLAEAAEDPTRADMLRLVHDIYHQYIRRSITEDRLTFGISAMLAFSLLYGDPEVRARNSYRYVMIDEFQDTNASQLMIALMILREPNLCVVGDWKQGIYGFRYVSIENITMFGDRARALRSFLNEGERRVAVGIPEISEIALNVNYRSSGRIVDEAFRCLSLKATNEDGSIRQEDVEKAQPLEAGRADIPDGDTNIRYVQCGSADEEAEEVVRCIRDYVDSGRYTVHSGDSARPMGYGDIAVLCRKTNSCRAVLERLKEAGIPAFMQGDMEIMSTREGKLALAWLRYISNDDDPWGCMPILADLGYSLSECIRIRGDRNMVPFEILNQRKELRKKTRRITELLTSIYSLYGLNNEITQAIITTLSAAHRDSLLTISDLIRIIEDGIADRTLYPVENSIDSNAVTIMTMHKSKGLEFEAVIIPYMDFKTMPLIESGRGESFSFDSELGVRCSQEVGRFGDYSKICTSWRTKLAKASKDTDYSEERRLMFVAMSRARQYETLICGDKPSKFMKMLSNEEYATIPECPPREHDKDPLTVPRPDVTGYRVRTKKVGVHTLMGFSQDDGLGGMSEADEVPGKGKEYGERVHEAAQAVKEGWLVNDDFPEMEMIRSIVDGCRDADLLFAELDCTLPVPDCGIVLSGRIDLLAVYPDRVEVHDYKTDVSDRFEQEYMFQLSVYAEAASLYYKRRAVCFIDYVSLGRTKRFEPLTGGTLTDEIRRRSALPGRS